MGKIFLSVLLAFLVVQSVVRADDVDKFKMIVRKWKITNFEVNQPLSEKDRKEKEKMLKNASFEFRADSTCHMLIGALDKVGKWRLSADSLILIDDNGKEEVNAIAELTDTKFVIMAGEGVKVTMSYTPPPVPTGKLAAKLIAKRWHIAGIEMKDVPENQQKQLQEMLKSASIEFKTDGTTNTEMMNMKESGKWKVSGNNLIMIDDKGKRETSRITELTDSSLVLEGKDKSGKKFVLRLDQPQ